MRRIKLMADYECFPIWEASPGVVGNIDPQELPISSGLRERLMLWAETFDKTLHRDDPASSGFANECDESAFRDEGEGIARALQDELGDGYVVLKQL